MPISDEQLPYTEALNIQLENRGYRVKLDSRSEKISRKVAESEQKKVPFALVIGKREAENNQVSLREHGKGDKGVMSIEEVLDLFKQLEIH